MLEAPANIRTAAAGDRRRTEPEPSRLCFFVLNEDIVSGKDALLAGASILSHPPVLVHVLLHKNLVVLSKDTSRLSEAT